MADAPKKLSPRGKAASPPGAGEEVASPKRTATKPRAKSGLATSKSKFVRNIRGVLVRIKLDNGRSVVLEPRGKRGDMTAVSKSDMEDSKFLNNAGLLFEVLTSSAAEEVRAKQATNQIVGATHPSAALTGPDGKPMAFGGTTPTSEASGVTVATIRETGATSRLEKGESIDRVGPQQVNVPGSVNNPVPTAGSIPPVLND